MREDVTFAGFIRRIRAGDEQAARELVERYEPVIRCEVRTLRTESGEAQTPAMTARLTDHVWTLAEWLKRPAVQLV